MKNHLEKSFTEEFDFNRFYNFIKQNPFISLYINGNRYFFFSMSGRIYSIPEYLLSFVIFTISFFGMVGLREIFKKYEIRKNLKKKFGKIFKRIKNKNRLSVDVRGGEDSILHYEVDVIDDGKNFFPTIFSKLTSEERFIKAIVKKCLKPDRFYKISNRGLLEIVDKMMEFNRKDSTRIISYDVLILGLVTYAKPMSPIIYEGTIRIVKKLGYSEFVKNAPLIISVALGIIGGVGANLGGWNVLLSFVSTIPTWLGSYRVAESARNALAIDCTDYVEELPSLPTRSLALEAETSQNSKVSVSASKPTRHETFVSTAPGQELHYQEEQPLKMEAFDGFYKEGVKLNGDKTLTFQPHSQNSQVVRKKYIPLKDRTKTVSDIRDLDSTCNRESAERIKNQIVKEKIAVQILDEFLE